MATTRAHLKVGAPNRLGQLDTSKNRVGFRRFGGDMGWLAGVGALMGVSLAVPGAEFWTGGANICLRPARFRSGGRSSPVEPGQALHVVGEIGEADLGGGPGDADGADEQSHRSLLPGKHVFDRGTHPGFRRVGQSRPARHRPAPRFLAMNARAHAVVREPCLVLLRPVCGIGPHTGGGVALVDEPDELRAVMARGIGHRPGPDQAVLPVDRDVVLVAEGRDREVDRRHRSVRLRLRLGELHRPTRVTILLPQLGRRVLPARGDLAGLDRPLLFLGVALPRRRYQARVEDLARHGEIAAFLQPRVKYREQFCDRSGLGEKLAKQPDRLRVRRLVRQPHVEEAHERQPVADLELRLVVGEVIERLQHQDLEHQHAIVRRTPAAGPVAAVQRLLQAVSERLERHDLLQPNQWIARFRQHRIPIVEIKEPRLRHHLTLHRFARHSESQNRARH